MKTKVLKITRSFKNGRTEVYRTDLKGLILWLQKLVTDKERISIINRIKEKNFATFLNKKKQQYLVEVEGNKS